MSSSYWKTLLFVMFVFWLAQPVATSADAAELKEADLQAILNKANPGETIVLERGTYRGPLTIDKQIVLKGDEDGSVTLVNSGSQPALKIEASQVTIEGLKIIDESLKETPTVLVTGDSVMLKNLTLLTATDGIVMRNANGGSVMDSTIEWTAEEVSMADKGNGIDLYNAHDARLIGNVIRDVHDGIYLENSDRTMVSANRIERSRYGVHCMYTKETFIHGNEGSLNVTGAMVMASQQVVVTDNTFTKQSENVNSQGILLYDVHGSTVSDNTVDGNRVGLYVEESRDNLLENNNIQYNFVGILMLDASDNTMKSNVFVGNVSDAQARSSASNDLTGNYWDGFQGIDPNGDGRSDITYSINPFFQGLVHKQAAFQLFFQSPGMVFLEGLYQTQRNTWITDQAPLMKPPEQKWNMEQQTEYITGIVGLGLFVCTGILIYLMRRRKV